MFIIDVIPLTRLPRHLPQTLSYFYSKEIKKGVLAMVKIRNKETPAVIIRCEDARNRRIEIKRKGFEMKPINKIISNTPILTENQIRLGFWMAKYYLEPLTFAFKAIAPKLPKKITKELIKEIESHPAGESIKSPFPSPKPQLLKSNDLKHSLEFLKKDIQKTLAENRQILILVPEINLAEKILALIRLDFPDEKILDLSGKSSGNKFFRQYLEIKNNKAKIIITTRSGALLPFFDLGTIIVAEENNDSHKQWEGHPLYDARDIAAKLAEFFSAKIIFESSTPSIASYYKAQSGIYEMNELPEKHAAASPEIIDMRLEQRKGNFSALSETFTNKIAQIIKEKKRAVLFINRRGAANFIVCKNCGEISKCPICRIPLIYYPEIKNPSGAAKYERLICNHCNFSCQPQNACPKCKGVQIKYMGLGTQKIENQIKRDLPHLNVLRLDSDTAKNDKDKILDSFANKTPSILVATQQIFSAPALPEISFIGIISLDAMLAMPDFRSNERVFSSIAKLFAISHDLKIQTYNPENQALKFLAKMDYKKLCEKEIDDRRLLFYPPFSEIIKLNYRHSSPQSAKKEASLLAELIRKSLSGEIAKKEVRILGPAPRFIFQEKGFYNWHIILKIKNETGIESSIKEKLEKIIPENWEFDVNPENLL